MERYLQTTDNPNFHEKKATISFPGYNANRCGAFMRGGGKLYKHPLFQLAADTMTNRRSRNRLMTIVPPEMSAMVKLHNQICPIKVPAAIKMDPCTHAGAAASSQVCALKNAFK